jgi:hypothetical protein
MAWREAGRPGMSFVMLNRFLDLCDAMDEPDSGGAAVIENADFAGTDVPFDFHVPRRPYVAATAREEVRCCCCCCCCWDWVDVCLWRACGGHDHQRFTLINSTPCSDPCFRVVHVYSIEPLFCVYAWSLSTAFVRSAVALPVTPLPVCACTTDGPSFTSAVSSIPRKCLSIVPQVRNYVLELSMDTGVDQSLALRVCERCGTDTYEANLTCHSCRHTWEPCAVSGYPVQVGELLGWVGGWVGGYWLLVEWVGGCFSSQRWGGAYCFDRLQNS